MVQVMRSISLPRVHTFAQYRNITIVFSWRFREFMTGDKFLTCSNYVLNEKQIVNTSFWFCNFTLLLLHKFCNPHKHFLLISQIIQTLTTTVSEVVLYLTYFSRYSDDFAVIVLHGSFGNSQGVPDSCFHFIPEPDYHVHSLTAGNDLSVGNKFKS